jgi:hypothetical protein
VSAQDFITVQSIRTPRTEPRHSYRLTGLLRCAACDRLMQAAATHGNPAYRCRHGHTSGSPADRGRMPNAYVREDHILARLPLLHALITRQGTSLVPATASSARTPAVTAHPEEMIEYLRQHTLVLRYNHETRTLEVPTEHPVRITV